MVKQWSDLSSIKIHHSSVIKGHHQIGCVRLQSLCLHLSLFRPGINFNFENRLCQNRVANEISLLFNFSLRLFCLFVLLVSCNILLAGFVSCKELAKSHAQNLNRKENPALSYSDVELQVCSVLLFGGQYRRRDIAKALPGSLTRLIHPLPTLSLLARAKLKMSNIDPGWHMIGSIQATQKCDDKSDRIFNLT